LAGGTFDWDRIIKDLAQHLVSAPGQDQIRYILADAERDVTRLGRPPDFWNKLLVEYEACLIERPIPASSRSIAKQMAPVVRATIRSKATSG
jgi:hypothetical protein